MRHRRICFVIASLVFLIVVIIAIPAIQQARETARRTHSMNNLKTIVLSLHNYHDVYNHFPPGGTFDSEGTGFHGWMTLFFPYFESSRLYSQIDFQHPWNSPHNAGWLRIPISIFQIPCEPVKFDNCGFPLTHYSGNAHIMAANNSVGMRDLPSSASIFLVGELGGDFVPWSSPYNWRPLKSLNDSPLIYGRHGGYGAHFAFADGHVEFISTEVTPVRFSQICGPDLSGFGNMPANIIRPTLFPCPDHIVKPDFEKFDVKKDQGDRYYGKLKPNASVQTRNLP